MAENKSSSPNLSRLGPLQANKAAAARLSCVTEMKKCETSFLWTIRKLSAYQSDPVQSATFSCGEYKWRFLLYPKGEPVFPARPHTSIFLQLVSGKTDAAKLVTRVIFSFVSPKGEEIFPPNYNQAEGTFFDFSAKDKQKGVFSDFRTPMWIHQNVLFEDQLTIRCELIVFGETTHHVGIVKQTESSLSSDLQKLLEEETFADITLFCQGRQYPVHKTILAARSKVFCKMFQHNLKENLQREVQIVDLDQDVLEAMIHFMYTEKAPGLHDMADALLAAADKYQLDSLKLTCEEALSFGMTVDNVCHILILADMHSAKNLLQQAICYFKSHATQVMSTAGYQEMINTQRTHLVAEILNAFVNAVPPTLEPSKEK